MYEGALESVGVETCTIASPSMLFICESVCKYWVTYMVFCSLPD